MDKHHYRGPNSMCVICFESLANNNSSNNNNSNNNHNNHYPNNPNSNKNTKQNGHSEAENSNDLLMELPCCHIFHSSCIRHWIQSNQRCPSCPLCRSSITNIDQQQHYNQSDSLPHIITQNNNISNNNNNDNGTIQTSGIDDRNDPRCTDRLVHPPSPSPSPLSTVMNEEHRMEIDSIGEEGLNEQESIPDDDIPPPPLLTRSDGYYRSNTSQSSYPSGSPSPLFPSPALSSLLIQRGFGQKP